jgi:endonuclease YncB( thermonuclease family)
MFNPVFAMLVCFGLALAPGAVANTVHETIAGPVSAEIVRVIDGDTILVDASPWPQQTIEVYVRLRGIDAPELHSPCPAVRREAERAQAALEEIMPATGEVQLTSISGDKYFGRILADVTTADGRNPAETLLSAGYAVSYHGGRKPAVACPD